jgi:hypothetical protein
MADYQLIRRKLLLSSLALACAAGSAAADDGAASRLELSGFASIVAGRTFNSSLGDDYAGPTQMVGRDCPCYIADWTNAGVYENKWSLAPESRIGVQAKYKLTPDLNVVAQVTSRGTDARPDLQWAYASYAVNNKLEVQAGRKRIPLYYYSDFQDVGTAYPWVGTPPELYGWEATNYNGASVRYRDRFKGVSLSASVFTGKETVKDSAYYSLYSDGETKIVWKNIVGGDLEATRGPVTARLVYLEAKVSANNPVAEIDDKADLRAMGLAVNVDFDDWFVLSEVTRLSRTYAEYKVDAPAFTLGAGYRFGQWTPFVNIARYEEQSSDHDWYEPASYDRASVTVRYDFDARSSLKVQLDRNKDVTRNFGGSANIVRIAYDRLF